MAFRVNQKVVCIDATPHPWDDSSVHPVKGAVYTIAAVYDLPGGPVHLNFQELWWDESDEWFPGFCSSRFRPLTERKTSTGYEILEEIRKRESLDEPSKVDLPADCER